MKQKMSLLFAILLLGGCATTQFHSQVTSLSDTSVVGCCTFFILPADESVDIASLDWRTFERQLSVALELKGFERAAVSDEADIAIVAGLGIGDPRTETWTVPIWGQTGTITTGSTTTGTVNSYGNTATVNSQTTYNTTPTYGVIGSSQASATIYDRWLEVRAFGMKKDASDGGALEVWRTTVRSAGTTGDVYVVAPYMLAAAHDYFGENLTKQVDVKINEGAPVVQAIAK